MKRNFIYNNYYFNFLNAFFILFIFLYYKISYAPKALKLFELWINGDNLVVYINVYKKELLFISLFISILFLIFLLCILFSNILKSLFRKWPFILYCMTFITVIFILGCLNDYIKYIKYVNNDELEKAIYLNYNFEKFLIFNSLVVLIISCFFYAKMNFNSNGIPILSILCSFFPILLSFPLTHPFVIEKGNPIFKQIIMISMIFTANLIVGFCEKKCLETNNKK